MDELIISDSEMQGAEFYLATITGWNNTSGVKFQIDGQEETQKGYKQMLMCRPLKVGSRVVVMKYSGSYVVLGEISMPNSWKKIPSLASGATLTDVIAKVNELLAWLRTEGILWT